MNWLNWIPLLRRFGLARTTKTQKARLSLESLEDRCLLAASLAPDAAYVLKSDHSLTRYDSAGALQVLSPAGTILSVRSVTDAAGLDAVYAITADQHLWLHHPSLPGSQWSLLSVGAFQQLSAATDKSGNAVVFGLLADHSLWEYGATIPGDHWRMLSPGGTILSISAVTDAGGNEVVYAITADQHLWQHGPGGWALLSTGAFQQVSAGTDKWGDALVFGLLADNSLWENSPQLPGDHWRLLSPGGTILSISAGGPDEVFAITSDRHLWDYRLSNWSFLSPGSFSSLDGAETAAGLGIGFAVLTDGSIWEYSPGFVGAWRNLLATGAASTSVPHRGFLINHAPVSTPDLAAASDSGPSNSDNITNQTMVTISITATAGSVLTLLDGQNALGVATADAGAGTYHWAKGCIRCGSRPRSATPPPRACCSSPSIHRRQPLPPR